MGIDRQRIVDNFYPKGSIVAAHFTPCAIPGGCEGEEWYKFDPTAAKELLAEAGFPNGFETDAVLPRCGARLPAAARSGGSGHPGAAQGEPGHQRQDQRDGVRRVPGCRQDRRAAAAPAGLGRRLPGPDQLPGLPLREGRVASSSATASRTSATCWTRQPRCPIQAERNKLYAEANDLVKQHVPMVPVAHGGSATAFKADVTGAHASPLGNENFSVMDAGRPQAARLDAERRADQPLLRGREDGESLRACEQINESLLAYKIGGTDGRAVAGRDVHRQRGPDRVDLQPARGRQVPRRQRLRLPRTWSRAGLPSGMRRTRCTRAAPAPSPTSTRCSGPS